MDPSPKSSVDFPDESQKALLGELHLSKVSICEHCKRRRIFYLFGTILWLVSAATIVFLLIVRKPNTIECAKDNIWYPTDLSEYIDLFSHSISNCDQSLQEKNYLQ